MDGPYDMRSAASTLPFPSGEADDPKAATLPPPRRLSADFGSEASEPPLLVAGVDAQRTMKWPDKRHALRPDAAADAPARAHVMPDVSFLRDAHAYSVSTERARTGTAGVDLHSPAVPVTAGLIRRRRLRRA
jgi:hypothetical protein